VFQVPGQAKKEPRMSKNIGPKAPFFKASVTADELATVVRDEIRKAKEHSANALASGIAAGEALIAARQKVIKRHWGEWLRVNCSLATSTAKLYMQLARHRAEIEAAVLRGVDLSVRSARSLISKKPKDPSESSLPALPDEKSETLFAHWQHSSDDERTIFLDQVTVHGIRRVASEKFHRALDKAAATGKPYSSSFNLSPDEFREVNPRDNRSRH
jgi:hypothetical protein